VRQRALSVAERNARRAIAHGRLKQRSRQREQRRRAAASNDDDDDDDKDNDDDNDGDGGRRRGGKSSSSKKKRRSKSKKKKLTSSQASFRRSFLAELQAEAAADNRERAALRATAAWEDSAAFQVSNCFDVFFSSFCLFPFCESRFVLRRSTVTFNSAHLQPLCSFLLVSSLQAAWHSHLVLSTDDATIVLATGADITQVEDTAFYTKGPTLACANVLGGLTLQVSYVHSVY
jgi:hypothetical protein